jgi:outer membrane lipoprotein carrier protein
VLRAQLITGALLIAATFAPAAAASSAGQQRLERFLERVQSMRADFRQVVVDGDDKVIDDASGRLLFKRPGRFRWDYEKPYERVVVGDGKELWLYEADLAQVTVRPLAAGLGDTPAALLTGGRGVLDRFETVSSWSGDELAWVRLKPRSRDSDFESVAIGFAGESLSQLELEDRLGQRTRVYLTNLSLNPAIGDDSFRFDIPPGADVIREGEF